MKVFLLASMLLLLWAISCNKDKETSGLTIVAGSVCGWCAGTDSVIISEYRINYRNMQSCDHHAYSKVSHMGKSEWDKLNAIIDFDEFKNIRLNTCNVCVDGCDKWITIRNGSYSHTIRFGNQDSSAVQPIKRLVAKVDSLREVYRTGTGI
jgi:hypothetical protein